MGWGVLAATALLFVADLHLGPQAIEDGIKAVAGPVVEVAGPTVVTGTTLFLFLAPVALAVVLVRGVGVRYGRATLSRDRVVVRHPLSIVAQVVPTALIQGRTLTPHGVVLSVSHEAGSFVISGLYQLFVPARSDAEVAAAIRLLDAAELARTEGAPKDQFGTTWRVWQLFLMVMLPLGLAVLLTVQASAKFGEDGIDAVLPAFVLFSLAGMILFSLYLSRRRLVHVGRQSLALDHKVFPYADITRAAVLPGAIALEAGARREVAWVRPPTDALAPALAARLAEAGGPALEDELPPWAARLIAPRRAAVLALPLAFLFLSAAWLVHAAPHHVGISWADPAGGFAQVFVDLDRDAPVLLVTGRGSAAHEARAVFPGLWSDTVGPEDGKVTVDMTRRILVQPGAPATPIPPGTTWVHLEGPQARFHAAPLAATAELLQQIEDERAYPSLNALLRSLAFVMARVPTKGPPIFTPDLPCAATRVEEVLEAATPPLRDHVRGESGLRVVQVEGPSGRRLVWAVERGRVLFVGDLHPDALVRLEGAVAFQLNGGPPKGAPPQGDRLRRAVVVDADGSVLASLPAVPPADALWRATEAVRGGARVSAALAQVVPSLYLGAEAEPR
jgi:hypothetical protein